MKPYDAALFPSTQPATIPPAPVLPQSPPSDHVQLIEVIERALQSQSVARRILHIMTVSVPANASSFLIRLPEIYSHVTFLFRATTPAVFSIGPEGARLSLNAFRGFVTLPGTTNIYMCDSTGATFDFQIVGVKGYDPLTIQDLL